jgi:hypothetical protein
MVLLVNPGQEGLVLVMVDTTTGVPVLVAASVSQNTEK